MRRLKDTDLYFSPSNYVKERERRVLRSGLCVELWEFLEGRVEFQGHALILGAKPFCLGVIYYTLRLQANWAWGEGRRIFTHHCWSTLPLRPRVISWAVTFTPACKKGKPLLVLANTLNIGYHTTVYQHHSFIKEGVRGQQTLWLFIISLGVNFVQTRRVQELVDSLIPLAARYLIHWAAC